MTETRNMKRPMSPRRKRYTTGIILALLVGAVIGAVMQLGEPNNGTSGLVLLDDTPLTPGFATGAAILWTVGLAVCLVIYHRSVDDHEEHAYLWAGLAAWYTFTLSAPTWWVLHRASLAPAPDVMLLFVGALAVNVAVWLWLKYR